MWTNVIYELEYAVEKLCVSERKEDEKEDHS